MTSPRSALRALPPGGAARAWDGPARARASASAIRGFSLLEVLVAFVILALVATALFRLIGGALGNAGAAADASRALLVAQSRLDAARGGARLAGESGADEDGRISWTTSVEPFVAPDTVPGAAGAPTVSPTQLYRIRVEVRYPGAGGRERSLELSTLRLAKREGT
jgi:general secretion pathway protein I